MSDQHDSQRRMHLRERDPVTTVRGTAVRSRRPRSTRRSSIWFAIAATAMLLVACTGKDAPREIQVCDPLPIEDGRPCSQPGQRCWAHDQGFACSEAASQGVCECTGGAWTCAPSEPVRGDPVCLANDSCYTEGHALCDADPPPDRHCRCDANGAAWSCFSICEGCPSAQPVDGAACSPIPEGHCSYSAACCTCIAGAFSCTAHSC